MRIVVVGSVALDTIKTPFGQAEEIIGGSATHFAAASSFFTEVRLVGIVGEDFPSEHLSFLRERGIDLTGLQIVEGRTFRWQGYYEYDLNQAHTLETQLNVFESFHPHIPESYKDSEIVFLANIDPDLQFEVLQQVESPQLKVMDTMNYWIENKRESLINTISQVDIVLMNDSEARELCNTFSLLDAARLLMSWGPRAVILKKGEHGALMFTDEAHFSAPAFPIEEIKDPTGAGDSFAGGFLGYLAKTGSFDETDIRKAVIYGSVLASYNVEGFSLTRLKDLSWSDIETRFADFKDITVF